MLLLLSSEMVFVETAVLLGWAGLGWAGLGWAGHEDQHFITITSLPPRSSCPAPARWPVSSSKSPEVNEFSVLLKHNDHMTLPCRYFHWHFCLLQPDYRLTKHQGRHCWTTLARVSSKVQSVGGRTAAAAPWPDLVTTIHPHHHSTTYICTSPLLLCHKLRR